MPKAQKLESNMKAIKTNKAAQIISKAEKSIGPAAKPGKTPKTAPAPAVKTTPPNAFGKGAFAPLTLNAGEQWFVNLGHEDSNKGCALFPAKATKTGFIPTRDDFGQPVTAQEVPVDAKGLARNGGYSRGNPTPQAFRAWVSERRDPGCTVLPLKAALAAGALKAHTASVNGTTTKVYLPKSWQQGQKLPLYVGIATAGGRVETFTHKVKTNGVARNAAFTAKLALT